MLATTPRPSVRCEPASAVLTQAADHLRMLVGGEVVARRQ
jgi:hypothetical protein